MIKNEIKPTPILYGEDARRFEEAIKNPKKISNTEYLKMLKNYNLIKDKIREI